MQVLCDFSKFSGNEFKLLVHDAKKETILYTASLQCSAWFYLLVVTGP